MEALLTSHFWIAAGQIVLIDVLLGGDNAVAIALACRKLPASQRIKGIVLGTAGAIVLRVLLIVFALTLLQIPFLRAVGAILLIWIGVKLIVSGDEDAPDIQGGDRLWGAVKTIIVADFVMSLENVIGIASAAQNAGERHQLLLVIFGLLVSVPIIIGGSQLVLKLMERFPVIILLGGMLLGWIAGGLMHGDPGLAAWMPQGRGWHHGLALAGALLVMVIGRWLQNRQAHGQAATGLAGSDEDAA